MSMDGLLPLPPEGDAGDPESTSIQDPRYHQERQYVRWEKRSAQWRALILARHVFGEDETAVDLAAYPSRGGFRGLLHLRVPFDNLEDHQRREAWFGDLAARDEVLSRVPMVFVFDPVPVTAR